MTIREAIGLTDRMTPNAYDSEDKLRWLSELDGVVSREILEQHAPEATRTPYTLQSDIDSVELCIPWPYDGIYRCYLEMKICEANGETVKYNNAAARFSMYYQAFANAYHRGHMPKQDASGIRV